MWRADSATIRRMEVDVREVSNVIIVDLKGKLVSGVGDELLAAVMDQLLADGWSRILLNLSDVPSIDSAGIGELVASQQMTERFGGKLKVLRLGERVRKSLSLSQVLPLLDIYDDEAVALAAFEETEST